VFTAPSESVRQTTARFCPPQLFLNIIFVDSSCTACHVWCSCVHEHGPRQECLLKEHLRRWALTGRPLMRASNENAAVRVLLA
jgi:hypothetical protein